MFPADQIYHDLMGGPHPCGDAFDAHVAACVLTVGLAEARQSGRSLNCTIGLTREEIKKVAEAFFPHAVDHLLEFAVDDLVVWADDETYLRDLLSRMTTSRTGFQMVLTSVISRRCQGANHLWQDMGLKNRGELGRLMERYFLPLKQRNTQDMKWKKFLYKTICRDEGYGICSAPTCGECDEYHDCFDIAVGY